MKKKEIDHLKEDEFVTFIEKVLKKVEENKKVVMIGAAVILGIILLIIFLLFLNNQAAAKDNEILHKAVIIRNSNLLSLDRKIEKLEELKATKGLSYIINNYLSAMYLQKGDISKARELLNNLPKSRIKVSNEQRELLNAEIYINQNEEQKALDIFNRLLSDSQSEIAKDYLLLKIAKIQYRQKLSKKVKETIDRLIDNFPQSVFRSEGQQLLDSVN